MAIRKYGTGEVIASSPGPETDTEHGPGRDPDEEQEEPGSAEDEIEE